MVKPRLVLILGDQLSMNAPALLAADKTRDVLVMAEVMAEGTYVPHHPKKIILILTAMRKFAAVLEADGWRVAYTKLDDPENSQSIVGELLRRAEEFSAEEVLATEPGEWRLIHALADAPLRVYQMEDTRFLASHAEFSAWAKGRKQLRMEYFYREMRRKTGLLMEGDQPAGGKWNYDHDNRKAAKPDMLRPKPLRFEPCAVTEEVTLLVEARFNAHFGAPRPFWMATDRAGALAQLDAFVQDHLPQFGDYQDAMLAGDPFLHHSLISAYLNIGHLDAREICDAVAEAYARGHAPLNAAEGYIRQIIGWREYMRGIYYHEGPDYTGRNALGAVRPLPEFYWTGETDMACLRAAIGQTREEAYAHHIQRLMVTGNFALLAGIDPHAVHEWYLAVYWDAFEWVEAPNTIGMSQFADDGIIASKPYISSGAYIDRMSDYCSGCAYSVKAKMGQGACPFNLLYWDFIDRHEERFANNPRMGQMVRNWARRKEEDKAQIRTEAAAFLEGLV